MIRVCRSIARWSPVAVTLALTVACGGRSNPTSPSSQLPIAVTSGFGALSAQTMEKCFQFVGDAACFLGARVRPHGVAAAGAAPSAPSGLTASAAGSTVTLTWLAPSGTDPVTSYIIEAGSAPGLANLANFSTGTSATSFTAGGVPAGSYYVRVRASNGSGASAPSNEVLLVVGSSGPAPCSAPAAPAGLTSSVSGSTVTLRWSAASGATSYVLQAGSSPGLSNLASSDIGNTTAYTATGVGNGTYYVRVVAKNACGSLSGASNEVTLVLGSTPTPTTLVITSWGAQLQIQALGSNGGYLTTGQIFMTTNIPVTGLLRAEFQSTGKIGGTQRFIGQQRNLTFQVFVIGLVPSPCPDLHGTKTLSLFDDDHGGVFLASIQAEPHGTGCAFDP